MGFFSPAQILGYLAFVLGVSAFLQKSDRRLKYLISGEGFIYTAHFAMLGNFPASSSAFLSATRTLMSIRWQSAWLAVFMIVANLACGIAFVKTPTEWLPVLASCAATVAFFYMSGIPLRLVLLCCTIMWLINNICSHSIGGTALEAGIAIANGSTIWKMMRESRSEADLTMAGQPEDC